VLTNMDINNNDEVKTANPKFTILTFKNRAKMPRLKTNIKTSSVQIKTKGPRNKFHVQMYLSFMVDCHLSCLSQFGCTVVCFYMYVLMDLVA